MMQPLADENKDYETALNPAPQVFPPLPIDGPRHGKSLRVCFVSFEFLGPAHNSGLATAVTTLGEALAADGHRVTFLQVRPEKCVRQTIPYWIEHYRNKNIDFVPLSSNVKVKSPNWMRAPYEIYLWLKDREFDIIHAVDYLGFGYYYSLAKSLGLGFANTLLLTGTHGVSAWATEINYDRMHTISHIGIDFMEQNSIARSDVVVSPSHYLFRWMQSHDWHLPQASYVQQNVLSAHAVKSSLLKLSRRFDEIVFFGRLEPRKGFELFCDALELMPPATLQDVTITFLGKDCRMHAGKTTDYLAKRLKKSAVSYQVFDDKGHDEALDYLTSRSCLVVMPSRGENSPCAIQECISAGIPFLASDVGGVSELIDEKDRARVCFPPTHPHILAGRLEKALAEGQQPAKGAVDFDANRENWLEWHRRVVIPAEPKAKIFSCENLPVSICLYTRDHPQRLKLAIKSLEQLDYPNFEVIVVDDGSTDLAAIAQLDELAQTFKSRNWKMVRLPRSLGPGAALNAAAKNATGVYLQMMHADDQATPQQLAVSVSAAEHSGSDVMTSFFDTYDEVAPKNKKKSNAGRWLFLGPSVSVGALQNCYGTHNALIRRDVFEKLGGYNENRDLYHPHWKLYSRAILAGYRINMVPDALYRCRFDKDRSPYFAPDEANNALQLQPYLEALPHPFRSMGILVNSIVRPWPKPYRNVGWWERKYLHLKHQTINVWKQLFE